MPIISIPILAKTNYINLCHDAYESKSESEYQINSIKVQYYSKAIKDICGLSVWASIVMEADLSFDEDIACCCGLPFTFKNKKP